MNTSRILKWEDLWTGSEMAEVFGSSWTGIQTYLNLTERTESPRHYHLWALLFLTAATASNHIWIDHGAVGKVRMNMGVVLSGRPAIRKSSAISFMRRFAQQLKLNVGPTDTGGARHGVMSAMQSRWQDDRRDQDDESGTDMPDTLSALGESNFDSIFAQNKKNLGRSSSIVFLTSELGRLLTAQTRELLDFFADGLDGESIYYQTKHGRILIPNPCINLLGATTPGSLPAILPRDAANHGFLSRVIFVYANRAAPDVPIPPTLSKREIHWHDEIFERMRRIQEEADGQILQLSKEGKAEYSRLYSHSVPTVEFKLNAYSGRRGIHLLRTAGIICLIRGESPYVISRRDVGLAHIILSLTEHDMDGAYAGLDKSLESRAYAIIRELIESLGEDGQDKTVIHGALTRAGYNDDEITRVLERLLRSARLSFEIDRIKLTTSLGGEKARIYLNRFVKESVHS